MKRLLVVDDDPDIRLQLKAVLEAYHFTVETAANGQEALERVKAMVPDGIFLDLRMPVMDGLTALDVLRREYPSITVIAITASTTDDVIRHVGARGAHGCLLKPFDPQALRAALQDAFGWTPAPAE
jgi:two-component system response regulator (stage 0 sporulation protein F)